MAKIKLGTRPKTFEHTVKVQLHEGQAGEVRMLYIYRTRTEFGEFVDSLIKDAGTQAPASASDDDVSFSLRAALERTRDTNADYILKVASGWNLDEEFSRANLVQLCDELPGVAFRIIDDYRAAITEGRLGN